MSDILWERVYGGSINHAWERCSPDHANFKKGWRTKCGLHKPMALLSLTSSRAKKCATCLALIAAERGE